MKYAVQMGSGAMIFTPRFINIGSGIQKLTGEVSEHMNEISGSIKARGFLH
jgi:hypothetical protein